MRSRYSLAVDPVSLSVASREAVGSRFQIPALQSKLS